MSDNTQSKKRKEIVSTIAPFSLIFLVMIYIYLFYDTNLLGFLPIVGMILFAVVFFLFLALLKSYQIRKGNRILAEFAQKNNLRITHLTKDFLFSEGDGDRISGAYRGYDIVVGIHTSITGIVGFKVTEIEIKNKSPKTVLVYNQFGNRWHTKKQIERIPLHLMEQNGTYKTPARTVAFNDAEFEKRYIVYAEDKDFAKHIITQTLRNKLKEKKIQILVTPEGVYYSKAKLPQNFKDLQSDINFLIEIATNVNSYGKQ